MQLDDMENLLNFNDKEMCEKIDSVCPVLSSALRGAMGGKNQLGESPESPNYFVIRTLCYGAIFKAR